MQVAMDMIPGEWTRAFPIGENDHILERTVPISVGWNPYLYYRRSDPLKSVVASSRHGIHECVLHRSGHLVMKDLYGRLSELKSYVDRTSVKIRTEEMPIDVFPSEDAHRLYFLCKHSRDHSRRSVVNWDMNRPDEEVSLTSCAISYIQSWVFDDLSNVMYVLKCGKKLYDLYVCDPRSHEDPRFLLEIQPRQYEFDHAAKASYYAADTHMLLIMKEDLGIFVDTRKGGVVKKCSLDGLDASAMVFRTGPRSYACTSSKYGLVVTVKDGESVGKAIICETKPAMHWWMEDTYIRPGDCPKRGVGVIMDEVYDDRLAFLLSTGAKEQARVTFEGDHADIGVPMCLIP